MGNKWNTIKLKDITTKITKGSTPTANDGGFTIEGINFIKAESVDYSGNIDTTKFVYISEEINEKYKRSQLAENDILFSMAGAFLGKSGFVEKIHLPANTNQALALIRIDTFKAYPKFVHYVLQHPSITHFVNSSISQSAQPNINLQQIGDLDIFFPPLSIQQEVADFLLTIDKKITINRQINQTLEQMAQTLFKSWFVDFDPVIDNALDAGNEIPESLQARAELRQQVRASQDFQPLPAEVRALFPAEFEESELGWVPKGWECKDMTQLVDTVSITYPLKSVEKVIFLNTGDIENGRFLHCNYSSVEGLPGQAKKSIQKGDILFSEIRPQNKRFAFVNFDADHHVVSTKLMVLRAKDKIDPLLPYFILTLEKNTDELQRIAELRSGTFPQITYKELEMLGCVLPNNIELLDVFVSSYLKPMYSRNFALTDQNEQLAQLRDTLLPKLISGELRLDDLPDEVVTAANE